MGRKRWLNVFMEPVGERRDEAGELGYLSVGIAFLGCVCFQGEAASISLVLCISEDAAQWRCAIRGAHAIMAV